MMRAKFQVTNVTEHRTPNPTAGEGNKYAETLEFIPVTTTPFGSNGESEDNTFARWTPGGALRLEVTNPALWGKFAIGDKFYADFTPAPKGV